NSTDEEIAAATKAVTAALQHALMVRARKSQRMVRELPLVTQHDDRLLEGVLDLAFLEDGSWVVLDFKTDAEDLQGQSTYRRQLRWYIHAMEKLMGTLVSGYLLYV